MTTGELAAPATLPDGLSYFVSSILFISATCFEPYFSRSAAWRRRTPSCRSRRTACRRLELLRDSATILSTAALLRLRLARGFLTSLGPPWRACPRCASRTQDLGMIRCVSCRPCSPGCDLREQGRRIVSARHHAGLKRREQLVEAIATPLPPMAFMVRRRSDCHMRIFMLSGPRALDRLVGVDVARACVHPHSATSACWDWR